MKFFLPLIFLSSLVFCPAGGPLWAQEALTPDQFEEQETDANEPLEESEADPETIEEDPADIPAELLQGGEEPLSLDQTPPGLDENAGAPLQTAPKPDIIRMQTGPGAFGTLSPVDGESPLRLITENVVIYPQEDKIEISGEYALYNPSTFTVIEEIGFPTLSVNKGYINMNGVELSSGAPLFTRGQTEIMMGEKLDFKNALPLIETFDVKLIWQADRIEVAPDETFFVNVNVRFDYLYKEEDLRGGTEKSKKVFHYIREFADGWAGDPQRAILYVTPQIKQDRRIQLGPRFKREKGGTYFFKFDGEKPSSRNNVWLTYDPITFTITKDALGAPPVQTLEAFDNRDYDYDNLFDGDLFTVWCEGVPKGGQSKGFGIEWGKHKRIKRITVFPGMNPDPELFRSRNRLKLINIYLSKPGYISPPIKYHFEDQPYAEAFALNRKEEYTTLYFQILEVFPGEKYDATCVSEIDIEFED